MEKHQLTFREVTEERLMKKFPDKVKPFRPKEDILLIERYKQMNADERGISYGFSSAGFALYCTGYNPRGKSALAPVGLLYHDGDIIFPFGCFKREGEERGEEGYLIIVSPTSKGLLGCPSDCGQSGTINIDSLKLASAEKVARTIHDFAVTILSDPTFPIKGIYIRFLYPTLCQAFLGTGFSPIERNPWHPSASQEDETYSHGFFSLADILDYDEKDYATNPQRKRNVRITNIDVHIDASYKDLDKVKPKLTVNRFRNFLARNNLRYVLTPIQEVETWQEKARKIVEMHFKFLREKEKAIGSTAEDYYGLLTPEIVTVPAAEAYFGMLTNGISTLPISVYVGERTRYGPKDDRSHIVRLTSFDDEGDTLALYAMITLRDSLAVLPTFDIDPNDKEKAKGFSAISMGCLIEFLMKMFEERNVDYLHFGGSETKDLDDMKRSLGAQKDETKWVVKLRDK